MIASLGPGPTGPTSVQKPPEIEVAARGGAGSTAFPEMDWKAVIDRIPGCRRILVIGSPGSGKSYLSQRLGERLGLEIFHLDAIFWRPGRLPTPPEEWRETVASLVRHEAWVMDGTYEMTLDLRIPAADAVLLIDKSRTTCMWRVFRRKAINLRGHGPDAPHGHGGGFDWQLLKYVWQFPTASRPFIVDAVRKHGPDKLFLAFQGMSSVSEFLVEFDARTNSAP